MSDDTPKPTITVGHVQSFGWQRRPDLDDVEGGGEAWESPDGQLQMFRRGYKPEIAQIKNIPPLGDRPPKP